MKKPRSYIGFAAVFVIVALIQIAFYADGKKYIGFITSKIEESFFIEGELLNGSLICFIILQTLIIQMPLLVALVTGDLVSGEASSGTIRLLLSKPVSRISILWSKWMAGAVYTLLLLLWLGILALVISLLIFGPGDLVVLNTDSLVVLRQADVLWRFMAAFGIAFISLTLVATLSMALSCFTDNSIGPIITCMAIIILFTIIGTIEVPLFERIRPFLFTTHMVVWRRLFDNPAPWNTIWQSIGIMLGHLVVFIAISFTYFKKKDILS